MKRVIINVILLVLVMCSCYIIFIYDRTSIEVDTRKCYILNEVSSEVIYSKLSDNIYKTDVSGVSNIINQLILDDWSITKMDVQDEYIDAIFEKDNVVYRVYYEDGGMLTLLASPYERSKEIISYINDKRKSIK